VNLPDRARLVADLPAGVVPGALADSPRVVVTGCAGFIGSHLAEALLALGCRVVGVDSVNDYYDPALKRENLAALLDSPGFDFREADLLDMDPVDLLAGSRVCFHLAAQAGVRASWGRTFGEYVDRNVRATQHLLEACADDAVRGDLVRFVYSSSSSVYGDRADLPVGEDALPRPHSPYGVTKLAAEHLCGLYAANYGVPTVSLRYFTVYGPRQRPDMAFRRFIEDALAGRPWRVFGDGGQTRDFTYVADAVRANLLATGADAPGAVFNVGGGARISLIEALDLLRELLAAVVPDAAPAVTHLPTARGDVRDTWSDPARAREGLRFTPLVPFREGLAMMVDWVVERRRHA